MEGFKKCKRGHWHKEDLNECPYCSGKHNAPDVNNESEKTGVYSSGLNENTDSSNKTIVVGEKKPAKNATAKAKATPVSNKTLIEEEYEEETESGNVIVKKEQRSNRRLVGWLVTYSLDSLGIDYKLYEGRNVIGHAADSQITVNDQTVSGKHATILFRADKYKMKDELSSHGTFVNGKDIEDETFELHDGDIIKMGNTIFLFKSSIIINYE